MRSGPGFFGKTWLLLGRRAGRPESETVAKAATQTPRSLRQSRQATAADAQGAETAETVTRNDPQGRPRAPACETVANARPAMTSRLSGLEKSLLE